MDNLVNFIFDTNITSIIYCDQISEKSKSKNISNVPILSRSAESLALLLYLFIVLNISPIFIS